MQNNASKPSSTSKTVQRVRKSRTGRRIERSGLVTLETMVVWALFLITVAGNGLIEGLALGGVTSAMVAFEVYTWFTPAGYVFFIWTIIYIGLVFWLVNFTRNAPSRPREFGREALLFSVSCVLNLLWLVLWHYSQILLCLIVIAIDWVVLAALYREVRKTATSWMGWMPISIYASWLTVAVVANLANLLTRALNGGIPVLNEISTLLLVAAVLVLGYVLYRRYDDFIPAIVFVWAVVGVGVHVSEVSAVFAIVIYLMSIVGVVCIFVSPKSIRKFFNGS